ncbi:hypothetical protein HNR39_000654 [Glaciimonas immobilis]|uniref:Uncharacterized protein n=1 Tax=Glaciimonas immobilis TaxID=728004 RepID=A0A840RQ37_9BURK|nr:hypothetical protein [Glaciimonas immobilis]KAF3999354.1 hypothetical protein HAV38_05350 [Glaciimonas immobilis]MBB5198844.1 hypothetical protein [Glaciimonas immobilis]
MATQAAMSGRPVMGLHRYKLPRGEARALESNKMETCDRSTTMGEFP